MSYVLIRTLTIFGDCSFKATQLRPYRYMGSYLIPKGNHEYLLIHAKYICSMYMNIMLPLITNVPSQSRCILIYSITRSHTTARIGQGGKQLSKSEGGGARSNIEFLTWKQLLATVRLQFHVNFYF